jgi:hypothetical protein
METNIAGIGIGRISSRYFFRSISVNFNRRPDNLNTNDIIGCGLVVNGCSEDGIGSIQNLLCACNIGCRKIIKGRIPVIGGTNECGQSG